MKSLQVLTPARKCIFSCPFCISETHEHENNFQNNYENNYLLWKNNLIKVLTTNFDLKTVVITGTNEPMQDIHCINNIIEIVREVRNDIKIELQTRYYKKNDIYNKLDIVAFSISNYNMLDKIDEIDSKTRYTIILTDSFNNKNLDDILKKINKKISQITFKVLHDSSGYNKKIDEWIEKHKIDEKTKNILIADINKYRGDISIIFDSDCMNSENRYMVFREDGNLYIDFNSKEGLL